MTISYPLRSMTVKRRVGEKRTFAGTNLIREVSYLHLDEDEALAERAREERTSKSEIIRRALRAYLNLED